jgi:hypothetical protein
MRKVIVSNIMSDDGYYDGPGRNVMVLNRTRLSTPPERRGTVYWRAGSSMSFI